MKFNFLTKIIAKIKTSSEATDTTTTRSNSISTVNSDADVSPIFADVKRDILRVEEVFPTGDKKNSWQKFIDSYNSIEEIIASNNSSPIAEALDMNEHDFLNLMIKSFVNKALFNTVVSVKIDGLDVELKHPLTSNPLYYKDILIDRSGPKFGAYLNDQEASYYNNSGIEKIRRKTAIINQLVAVDLQESSLPNEAKLADAVQILNKENVTQRILSDFDLTTKKRKTLDQAIKNALIPIYNDKYPESNNLSLDQSTMKEVTKNVWQIGGPINTSLINQAIENKKNYSILFQENKDDLIAYPHMLYSVEPVMKEIFSKFNKNNTNVFNLHLDRFLGLGVSLQGPEYRKLEEDLLPYKKGELVLTTDLYEIYRSSKELLEIVTNNIKDRDGNIINFENNIKISQKYLDQEAIKHCGLYELGDVICDSSSLYLEQLDLNKPEDIAKDATKKVILELIGEESLINNQQTVLEKLNLQELSSNITNSEIYKLLPMSLKTSLVSKKDLFKAIYDNYQVDNRFIDCIHIFEESAKKASQCFLFGKDNKKSKIIGNISDIGPWIHEVRKKIIEEQDPTNSNHNNLSTSKSLLQAFELSMLINLPRWGVTVDNMSKVGDAEKSISADEFTNSINQRSYTYDNIFEKKNGVRKKLKYAAITLVEGEKRLNMYKKDMQLTYDKFNATEFKEYFQLIEHFSSTITTNIDNYTQAKDNLKNYLIKKDGLIANQFPDLAKKMNQLNEQGESFVDNIILQIEESIVFNINREKVSAKKAPLLNDIKIATGDAKKPNTPEHYTQNQEPRLH